MSHSEGVRLLAPVLSNISEAGAGRAVDASAWAELAQLVPAHMLAQVLHQVESAADEAEEQAREQAVSGGGGGVLQGWL